MMGASVPTFGSKNISRRDFLVLSSRAAAGWIAGPPHVWERNNDSALGIAKDDFTNILGLHYFFKCQGVPKKVKGTDFTKRRMQC